MKYLKAVIAYLWQIPQIFVGLILLGLLKLIYRQKVLIYKLHLQKPWDWCTCYLVRSPLPIGVSFGPLIFGDKEYLSLQMNHELGHSMQSLMLGWFYLVIVGIPSVTMNIISAVLYLNGKEDFAKNYYNRWPESWADTLGNVKR